MRLNPKVTWGLAWAGLALVVAVPSADFLTGRLDSGNKAAVITSDTDPVETATVTTTDKGITITPGSSSKPKTSQSKTSQSKASPAKASASKTPVKTASAGGPSDPSPKKLPSYISDGDSQPALAVTTGDTPQPTKVASVPDPVVVPPTPAPASARPKPYTAPAAPVGVPVANTATDAPVIVDEDALAERQEASQTAEAPVPPANVGDGDEDWDANELRTYLEGRGLIDNASSNRRSSASVTQQRRSTARNSDGEYLDDRDGTTRADRRARVNRLFEDDEQGFDLF